MKFITKEKESAMRLDKFLAEKLTNESRSQIKKMIQDGLVSVNGQIAKVHRFLKPKDEIIISKKTSLDNKIIKTAKKKKSPKLTPKIIFEDNDFLVLEKPSGLLVHPTAKGETDTLSNWLVKKYPTIKNVGEHKYRAGIIHRLDRDVSGIMLATKTQAAFSHLKEQFKKRAVKKQYFALVYGETKPEEEINLPIGRNKDGQFVAHPRHDRIKFQSDDKIAKTRYQALEHIKGYTLLNVEILTGRTHQIRAHLSAIGHPILGDEIYKPKKKFFHSLRQKIKVVDLPQIFLYSARIGFFDLQHQWREFNQPLPKKFKDYLNEIKK